ncbi:MAG: ATP-dependent protease Lon, partial [bacterium]|nr:ATP-dependent protease Lon [bacterium]
TPVVVRADSLRALVGPARVHRDAAEQIDRPGIAMGLAWTPVGGEVLFVEAAAAPDRGGKLLLTGMLGEVMRESAETALSYLLSNAALFGVPPGVFAGKTVHVHVPAGGIPKDGPSAGVAILTALASLATGRTARPNVAMTGEITLRGKVLPVGGIPEKVLAAYRAGVSTIILPRSNVDALENVPEEVRSKLRFEWADSADQVLRIALPEAAEPAEPVEAPAPPP